ncbi:OmpA family protein [Nisaea sp.]|uniref:OmpA family protein n=1 Tax=Nisaea sp. TaxID=2024842 RepID=UPI003B516AAE
MFFATALTLSLGGCSSVPDALNPVEWYESSTEAVGSWFREDDTEQGGDTGTYPNVASVPDKPAPSTSSADRAAIREQLVADRENAQYDDSQAAPVIDDAAAQTSAPASDAAPAVASAPASGAAQSSKPAPAPETTSEPIKPIRMTSTDEATRQIAQTAPRSSLWPNAPVPESAGDRAVTNARVGDPIARSDSPIAKRVDAMRQSNAEAFSRTGNDAGNTEKVEPQAVQAEPPRAEAPQVAAVPAPAEEPVQVPQATAPSESLALTPPSSESFNTGDSSVIVDESALPGAFQDYRGGQGGSYQAGVIRFSNGSATLSSADQGVIRELVPLIRDYNAMVEIVGHASSRTRNMDPFEHKLVNFEMSLQRANAVAAALINAGAPSERISVVAVGDSQPLSSEAMPAGEAENRRAEIYLIY